MLNTFLDFVRTDVKSTLSEDPTIEVKKALPDPLPLEIQKWVRINGVAVAFVDMVDSSKIDFRSHPKTSASIYETFTGILVDTMSLFDADYIDVKGDGALSIFIGEGACAKAFLAAVSFRTACELIIRPSISAKTNGKVEIKTRTGISSGDTIVKRIGRRGFNNEVWAYRTVNETAKLCSLAEPGRLVMGSEAFNQLKSCDQITYSCGCTTDSKGNDVPGGTKKYVWERLNKERLADSGIVEAHELLPPRWCKEHGREYLQTIADLFEVSFPKLQTTAD